MVANVCMKTKRTRKSWEYRQTRVKSSGSFHFLRNGRIEKTISCLCDRLKQTPPAHYRYAVISGLFSSKHFDIPDD